MTAASATSATPLPRPTNDAAARDRVLSAFAEMMRQRRPDLVWTASVAPDDDAPILERQDPTV